MLKIRPVTDKEAKPMMLQNLAPWQRKKLMLTVVVYVLVFGLYLGFTSVSLYRDRKKDSLWWGDVHTISEETMGHVNEYARTSTVVTGGTYVEALNNISLRNSSYTLTMEVWFSWEGREDLDMMHNFRIYGGTINSMTMLRDLHENGSSYQRARITATMSESYWTKRFPLDSHLLSCYIESTYPASEVLIAADKENSGYNEFLEITGYKLNRIEINEYYFDYHGTHGDPTIDKEIVVPELVTSVSITRNGFGLYAKCFIALVGTITWVLITMYINTYHHVDPLGMIPGALFGTVSNIMVGANLLPDALQLGLLEYVNILGILLILAAALSIINVNRIRTKYDDRAYAKLVGRTIFAIVVFFAVVGNLLLPLVSYVR